MVFFKVRTKVWNKTYGKWIKSKIFVLFGKKIVLLITLSFKLDGYVKIVYNFTLFQSVRRNWERNNKNSNSLEAMTQRKCKDIENVTSKKISFTSTVKMMSTRTKS